MASRHARQRGKRRPSYPDLSGRASSSVIRPFRTISSATYFLTPNSYLYLGPFNVERAAVAQVAARRLLNGTEISYVDLYGLTEARSKIFDDGGATVCYLHNVTLVPAEGG